MYKYARFFSRLSIYIYIFMSIHASSNYIVLRALLEDAPVCFVVYQNRYPERPIFHERSPKDDSKRLCFELLYNYMYTLFRYKIAFLQVQMSLIVLLCLNTVMKHIK